MSHPQPTPQDDDQTLIVHAVMNALDGARFHDIDCRDVRAVLDALKTLGYGVTWPWKLTDVEGVANLVAVQLPEPTAPDFTGLEWRDSAAGWDVFAYGSTQHRGRIQIRTPEFVDPENARNLAAALLAAAAKIEAGE